MSDMPVKCYYRTIVELKPVSADGLWPVRFVIIEPLWNWNYGTPESCLGWVLLLSNHCGIETCFAAGGAAADCCYYRTIVELKHLYSVSIPSQLLSYYRTIVELKHRSVDESIDSKLIVIIEPLWNWNKLNVKKSLQAVMLLSNHCGIETWMLVLSLRPYPCYYRTIVELKQVFFNLHKISNLVIIEPLWNWNRNNQVCGGQLQGYYRTIVELKQRHSFDAV